MCCLWTSDDWSVLDPMSQWWATPLCQGGVSLGCRCQKMQMFLLSALAQCEVRCSILGWKGSGRSWSPTPPFYLWEHLSSWKLAGILMEWWNQNAITSLPSGKVYVALNAPDIGCSMRIGDGSRKALNWVLDYLKEFRKKKATQKYKQEQLMR